MMRTRERVGIAVRNEETGEVVTQAFAVDPPKGRWAQWPLMRGIVAMRAAVITGQRSMTTSERLRWGTPAVGDAEEEEAAPPKILIALAALLGAAIQVAAFRVGPVVIAKEAGLTGATFIIADAAIRLLLLLGTLWLVSKIRPFRRILAYHGAEHKAIAAHEAGAPRTAAAAAAFSRFHPRCGTSFLVVSGLVSIGVYGAVLALTGVFSYPALIATRIIGAPIVTAITFELQRQAAKRANGPWRFLSAPGMWAQRLTTAPPREEELEVAVAALAVALSDEPIPEAERTRIVPALAPLPDAQPLRR